jgi:hypothetical protein
MPAIRNNQWSRDQINHPLNTPPGRTCPKCRSASVVLPAYNGDYFDCLDCGHSWPTTAKQLSYMQKNPASMFDANGRIPASQRRQESAAVVLARVLLGETVVTNDRVLNHALQQAINIASRRDLTPLDKFELLASYVLKSRREILGRADE